MNSTLAIKAPSYAPKWLKITAIIGVIWYAFGLLQFWLGYSLDTTAAIQSGAITAAHGAAIDGTPIPFWLAFAVASGAGLIGSVFLFTGSLNAKFMFAFSAISAVIYYIWVYAISGTGGDRPSEEIVIAIVVVGVTLSFLFLSRRVI